ncbi:late embryogenesis abundant protein, LEA5 [Tanacetum coccineum]|uniref:Late embryogenesis abundant protein, LEA5 n=1 Tax=Tanacetum coccineum TaxID=301880 RepID=A0ABQ5EMW3_9ASTR
MAAAEDVTTTCIPCLRSGQSCRNRCNLRRFFLEDEPQSVANFETIYKTYEMSYIIREVEDRLPDEARARRFINCLITNCQNRKIDPVLGSKGVYEAAQLRLAEAQKSLNFTMQCIDQIQLWELLVDSDAPEDTIKVQVLHNMPELLDAIIGGVPAPTARVKEPFQMIHKGDNWGRFMIGKITSGVLAHNQKVKVFSQSELRRFIDTFRSKYRIYLSVLAIGDQAIDKSSYAGFIRETILYFPSYVRHLVHFVDGFKISNKLRLVLMKEPAQIAPVPATLARAKTGWNECYDNEDELQSFRHKARQQDKVYDEREESCWILHLCTGIFYLKGHEGGDE